MNVSEGSRVVLALEGGYDPRGVADCVVEVVAALAQHSTMDATGLPMPGTDNTCAPSASQITNSSVAFTEASLVHEHTRVAVEETKACLAAHWTL